MKLNEGFLHTMKDVMARLRSGGAMEATEAIQRALRGAVPHPFDTDATRDETRPGSNPDMRARHAEPSSAPASEVKADAEDRGHFSRRTFRNAAGQRDYKVYVPASYRGEPAPLVVMLHGCTQNADDFAAGTRMNALAERDGFMVVYPVQPQGANPSKCWNWFKPADQRRDSGEPSLIAGITREVMATHPVDPARVYVAGLSAGGAMAAIMIRAYPDLYAAAGVHSGLAAGSAHDLPSALAAMRGGKATTVRGETAAARPLIVFHGDADTTVHASNAADVLRGFEPDGAQSTESAASAEQATSGARTAGRACSVMRYRSASGAAAECWRIHGAPHAWAGGDARGTYTDPAGPDASAEMLRFFMAHPQRRG